MQMKFFIHPGQLKFISEDKFTKVPRDIWRPLIRCVTVRSKGSFLDRHNLFYYKSKDRNPPSLSWQTMSYWNKCF